jgi:hypothetical protein
MTLFKKSSTNACENSISSHKQSKSQRRQDGPLRTRQQWRAQRRVGDLMRVYRDQFPKGLPHNALGIKYARYVCRTLAFDPIDTRQQWLDRNTPWLMGTEQRAKILALGPYWYADRSLGQHLEFYDEDRERLQAWTIEAVDVDADERKARNAAKHAKREEQRRRNARVQPRDQYLAANSKSGTQPWKALNMSRAKFYRLGLHHSEESRQVHASPLLSKSGSTHLSRQELSLSQARQSDQVVVVAFPVQHRTPSPGNTLTGPIPDASVVTSADDVRKAA